MDSTADIDDGKLTVSTAYSIDGKLKITHGGNRKIAVRRPGWCENVICIVPYELRDGYMYFEKCGDIELEFDMTPCLMRLHRR